MQQLPPGRRGTTRREASTRKAAGPVLFVIGCGSLLVALVGPAGLPPVEQPPYVLLGIEGAVSMLCGLALVLKNMSNGVERAVRFLQPLAGKPETLVRRYLGAPDDVEDHGPDGRLLTWRDQGYTITLRFRDRVCQGVVSEAMTED
jgi:hypothetical protein